MLKTLFPLGRRCGRSIYSIWDQFTTDRAAGSVNNTQAEPIGGVRTVVDTQAKLSLSSGKALFSGGKTVPAIGDPGFRLSDVPVSRAVGTIVIFEILNTSGQIRFGLSTVGVITSPRAGFTVSANTVYSEDGTSEILHTLITLNVLHKYVLVLRPSGCYFFIKGGAFVNYELIWVGNVDTVATLNVSVANYSAVAQVEDVRVIPESGWIPPLIAYDTFTRPDGAAGSTESTGPEGQALIPLSWSGGSVVGNQFVSTPTFGSNLITNGGFDTDTAWTKGTRWTIASGVASKTAGVISDLSQSVGTVNNFYEIVFDAPSVSSPTCYSIFGNGGWIGKQVTSPATGVISSRWQLSSSFIGVRGNTLFAGTIDNFSAREIDKSSLFKVVTTPTPDIFAEVAISMTNGTSAGLVINLDDETNPLNYVIAWHDGVNIHLDKCVNGVLTSLINVTQAYSGLGYMKLTKFGNKYRLYYTNVFIGTEQTITDVGIISNTKHGIYSTYGGNVFDNFLLLARGTSGEYSALDQF